MSWEYAMLNYAFLSAIVFGLCLGLSVTQSLQAVMFVPKDRLRVGPTLLGYLFICLARCLGVAPLGAVTMVGGSSDPSVPWSPGVTLQEKAGRPMGPSTLRCGYLWEVVVVYVGLLSWLCSFLSVLCAAVVISQGSVYVFGPLSPSRPDPCLFFNCLSSSFFSLSGIFVDAVSLSLSLSFSLSQALGKPKPRWGLGFPLCSLHPGRGLRLQPVLRAHQLPQGFAPRLFFFFFFRRRSFVGSVFFSFLVLVLVGFSGGGFGSVCVSVVVCCGRDGSCVPFFFFLHCM